LDVARKLGYTEKQTEQYKQLIDLLRDNDQVARLPQILQTASKQHLSVCALSKRIESAIQGRYRNQTEFTKKEYDIGLLALRLGGYRLLYAFHRAFGLPSLRTIMRAQVCKEVIPSLGSPDLITTLTNIQELITCEVSKETAAQRSQVGCQVSLDEVALKTGAYYASKEKAVGGICPCGITPDELTIQTIDDIFRIADKLFPVGEHIPECHFASFATVVSLNFLGKDDYHAIPFIVSPCCGVKDADKFKSLISIIIETWEKSGALAKYRWFWSVATDGDSSRRKGGFNMLLQYSIQHGTPLGDKLCDLEGMNLLTGAHGITLDFDWKHVIKHKSDSTILFTILIIVHR
jgi:hypothetical protein